MKHFYWTYVPGGGKKYKVGLLHGGKTGHLMVYCNSKIIIVDFKVRDSKVYSFFINDELCEIHLIRKGEQLFYEFHINQDADTPLNRARKKLNRKHLFQTLLFFGTMGLIMALVFWGLNSTKNKHSQKNMEALLVSDGAKTVGVINIEKEKSTYHINCFYVADNINYSSKIEFRDTTNLTSNNGMPLVSGDEFIVEYVRSNPSSSKIVFEKPTKKQLDLYKKRAIEKHAANHPQMLDQRVACQVDIAYQIKGLSGLADIFFQNTPPEENSKNNRNTFLKLIRDLPFQKKEAAECWD